MITIQRRSRKLSFIKILIKDMKRCASSSLLILATPLTQTITDYQKNHLKLCWNVHTSNFLCNVVIQNYRMFQMLKNVLLLYHQKIIIHYR
eukprot:UN16800